MNVYMSPIFIKKKKYVTYIAYSILDYQTFYVRIQIHPIYFSQILGYIKGPF